MKKILILSLIVITIAFGIYYFMQTKHSPYTSNDSRNFIAIDDSNTPHYYSNPTPSSDPASLQRLKDSLPHTQTEFTATWNEEKQLAEIKLSSPIKSSATKLNEWLKSIKAVNLPPNSLSLSK